MKNKMIKTKLFWALGAWLALFLCFLLCRFALFGLHGMKQWPLFLFLVGLFTIGVAAIAGSKTTMVATPIGYLVGFAAGQLLATPGVDQGGGSTSNAWFIWAVAFLAIVLAGVIWGLIARHKANANI
ncbi:hypothetical protein LJC61_04920 [Ruminococcaceae bacterium OttesenSCG-928-A16]|nr:hypothetical protein [Ruminococcaceae bacterium OttesenSCG-928-A16]